MNNRSRQHRKAFLMGIPSGLAKYLMASAIKHAAREKRRANNGATKQENRCQEKA
jgi:hypothetical protein